MNKKKVSVYLILSWLIGLLAVFSSQSSLSSFPKDPNQKAVVQQIDSPILLVRGPSESLEIPSFSIDLRLDGAMASALAPDFSTLLPIILEASPYAGTEPLFSVLITFFYFFYTW